MSTWAMWTGSRKPFMAPVGVIRIVPSLMRALMFPSAPTM